MSVDTQAREGSGPESDWHQTSRTRIERNAVGAGRGRAAVDQGLNYAG